jgi:hypothetical protein
MVVRGMLDRAAGRCRQHIPVRQSLEAVRWRLGAIVAWYRDRADGPSWRRGTRILAQKVQCAEVPLETLLRSLEKKPPHLVPGTAIFLTSDPTSAPTALLNNLKHNKVLHEHNVILTIKTTDTPRVAESERVELVPVSPLFTRVTLRFGFMETPNVPRALGIARNAQGAARRENDAVSVRRPAGATIGRAGGLCSKGMSRSMRSSTAEFVRSQEALIVSCMKVKPSPGEQSHQGRRVLPAAISFSARCQMPAWHLYAS